MHRKLASRADWQIAFTMAAGFRVFYSATAVLFVPFLHPDPVTIRTNKLTESLPDPHGLYYALVGVWERFDTLWFLQIAAHGYDRPMAPIFYPLYPAAIRGTSVLLPSMVAALLLSTCTAFLAFWGMLRLARNLSEDGRVRMLLLLGIWPASFILFAAYADSLTLALMVWAIVFGREARWASATVCAFLAGIARPSGVLVFVPLAVLALRSRLKRSSFVALTPLGLIAYWGWLRESGRLSVAQAYRVYQGMTIVPPWKSLADVLHLIAADRDALLAIKLGMVILFAALILYRGVRLEDKLFIAVTILQMLLYTGRPLLGAARYLLIIYPAFLVFGSWAERWTRPQFAFYITTLGVLNLAWMWAFLNWSLVL